MEEHKCAACGAELSATAEDEARAIEEARVLLGVENPSEHPDLVRVCDDCCRRQPIGRVAAIDRAYRRMQN